MPVTPNFSLPYPSLTDAPNGPAQIKALADAVDAKFVTVDNPKLGRVATNLITSNSATWSGATKVATNLQVTFTPVAGAVYRAYATFHWQCAAASNQDAMGLVWKAGASIAGTDPIIGTASPRSHPNGTGINYAMCIGEFTAGAAAPHAVGVVGWKPTGDTGASNLFANSTWALNQIYVDRVA